MAAADSTFQSLLQAALDGTTTAISLTGTATTTLLAGKAGFRAIVLSARLKSTHNSNKVRFAYGASPTDLTGDETLDDAQLLTINPRDYEIIAAPEGEDLKSVITVAGGDVGGFVVAGYMKVRG